MSTYIDLHVIQLVPPSCINRDDTGSPKSAVFGGTRRHRVSSQAWKRAVRNDFTRTFDASELGERTKLAVSRIAEQIRVLRPETDEETSLRQAVEPLTTAGISIDRKNEAATGYLLFLSRREITALAELALRIADGEKVSKKQAQAVLQKAPQSIDIALFGRMIADAPEANVDAACQVAHALSVHTAAPEFDYFTAVDDNAPEDNLGAGMIGTVEFVSSTLYRYATIDVDNLVRNIGDREAAARAVEAFTRSFVESMPTGKQNTFANRTRPDFVLMEVRQDQPVSLVTAFETPVDAGGGAVHAAVRALAQAAADGDNAFGTRPAASSFTLARGELDTDTAGVLADRGSVGETFPELVARAGAAVRAADGE
ncbi:type I-E CRISPR-associated protein Cas7/Cse4/CasC [Corynebacterium bovis]|uniref:type I-E CRISPR-associated protein Cas7/Cse4/CasC n=1 Tax=Corynebacterium bovis TaxID=36808 RepID=UPI003139C187